MVQSCSTLSCVGFFHNHRRGPSLLLTSLACLWTWPVRRWFSQQQVSDVASYFKGPKTERYGMCMYAAKPVVPKHSQETTDRLFLNVS